MKAKWIVLLLLALLTALAVGTAITAQALEANYFTWDPAAPEEGGGIVTFTATPPEGYSSLVWSRSTDPGGTTCDLPMGTAGDLSVSTVLLKSGVYQVCLKITYTNTTTYDDIQSVTVMNLPPTLGEATMTPATTVAGFPVSASVPITEYDSGITCTVDFGDGTDPVPGILNGSCTALHAYTVAGNYTVTFTVTEPGFDGVTTTASHTVVPPYANSIANTPFNVQNPEAALNAPDGLYASLFSDGSITLDLGAPVQGALLTLYHSTRSPACTVSTDIGILGITTAGADRTLLSLFASLPPSQSITIECGPLGKKAIFRLDAIQVDPPVPTGYAIGAMVNSGVVQNTGAVVGAPDGIYAAIGEAGGEIMLDMGVPMQAILTIYHSADSPACTLLWGGALSVGTTLPGVTSTSFIIPAESYSIQYFGIECAAGGGIFEMDAAYMQSTIEEPTGYAVATYGDTNVENPGAAADAPDGTYATMTVGSGDFSMILDLGAPLQGMLTVYHSTNSANCMVNASPILSSQVEEVVMLGVTHSGAVSTNMFMGGLYRYVWFSCYLEIGEVFELDAIHANPVITYTGYALTAFGSNAIQNPDAAIGEPDGQYAEFTGSGALVLDLGAVQQGKLMAYLGPAGGSCQVWGAPTFIDMFEPVLEPLEPIGWGPVATFSIPEGGVRYVQIDCTLAAGEVFELDAIHASPVREPTGYAVEVYYTSGEVRNAPSAVGEPDKAYAAITAAGGGLILDLGGPLQGDLTVYHPTTSPACTVFVSAPATPGQNILVGTTTPGVDQSIFAIPGDIQYVWVYCETLPRKTVFELDAVQVQPGTLWPTGYAVAVTAASSDVKNVANAVGAPDNLYAAITAADGTIILDLGGLLRGPLTVYHSSTSAQCDVSMSTEFLGTAIGGGLTTIGATSSEFSAEGEYRYVRVTCYTLARKQVFQFDSVIVPLPPP